MGAFVLRSQRESSHSAWLRPHVSDTLIHFPDIVEMSSSFQYPNGKYGAFGCLGWGVNEYPTFIFDFMQLIKGKMKKGVSSFYGKDYGNIGIGIGVD